MSVPYYAEQSLRNVESIKREVNRLRADIERGALAEESLPGALERLEAAKKKHIAHVSQMIGEDAEEEQPQSPTPQSSEGESTETMVDALPDSPTAETIETAVGQIDPMDEEDRAKYRRAIFADNPAIGKKPLPTDFGEPAGLINPADTIEVYRSNGSAEQTE